MDLNDANLCVVIKLIVATVRTNRYTLNNALFPNDCIRFFCMADRELKIILQWLFYFGFVKTFLVEIIIILPLI